MTRKIIWIVAATLLSLPLHAQGVKKNDTVITPAADASVTWIGRTLVQDGTVSFDWSGVYSRIAFEGNYLAVKASDSKKDYFNLWIDKQMDTEPDQIITLTGKDTTIVLFQGGSPKEKHTAILQKRTEGEQGTATLFRNPETAPPGRGCTGTRH